MAVQVPGLSTLNAVNQMLQATGDPRVAALDTGGTSDEGEAEVILDEKTRLVQSEGPGLLSGWHANTIEAEDWTLDEDNKLRIRRVALDIDTVAWNVTALTLTKVSAFSAYTFQGGDYVQVDGGDGVTSGWYAIASATDDALTLSSSIAAANNANTEIDGIGRFHGDVIAWEPRITSLNWTERDGFVWDIINETDELDSDPELNVVYELTWDRLPAYLRQHIADIAGTEFQRFKKRGVTDEQLLRIDERNSQAKAYQQDGDLAQRNFLTTNDALRVKGRRNNGPIRASWPW